MSCEVEREGMVERRRVQIICMFMLYNDMIFGTPSSTLSVILTDLGKMGDGDMKAEKLEKRCP